MAGSVDPFVRFGLAAVLARQLREAVGRVGIEEFRGQDERFDHHSRLGRELLYLTSNDEWIRATRESVTLRESDTVATSVQVHVDLGRITHEAFRNRDERVWLPLIVLPPPREYDEDGALPGAGRGTESGPGGVSVNPVARDQSGNVLPVLPQAEARHWIAAALAEIILNMAPLRPDTGHTVRPASRELAREQRLLLSAGLFRVLQRRAGAGDFDARADGGGLDPDGRIEAARTRLGKMLELVVKTLHRPGGDRAALVMQRAARIVLAVSSPTTMVVVAAPPAAVSTVYTVDLPSRPLTSKVPRWRGPRARLSIDALLPGTEADRSIDIRLPDGVSFTGHRDVGARPPSVQATVEAVQPRSIRQVLDLIGQLRQTEGRVPDPVARCLVDFTLARMETARDAFRHYRTTPEAARTGEAGQVDSVPAWLDDVRQGLEQIRADGEESAARSAREVAARAPSDLGDNDTLYRINDGAPVSPHRAHIQLNSVENRTVRATPVTARVDLDVVADRSAPLHAARYSGYMSLLLLSAVLLCWLLIPPPLRDRDAFPDVQVLASVLTLFAAVQAARIEHPERDSLRGLLISSGSWLVMASILPPVLLGVALAFAHSSTAIIAGAVAVQALVQWLMYLPPLTGQPWRRRWPGLAGTRRRPRLWLATGPAPDYRRTSVLLSSWWSSTTAAALQLGTDAYGYVVPQRGAGLLDLLGHGPGAGQGGAHGGGHGTGAGGNGNTGPGHPGHGHAGQGHAGQGHAGQGHAGQGHAGESSSAPLAAGRLGPAGRTPWVSRGLDLIATRLPKVGGGAAEVPQHPANILALLRAGAPGRALTFIVFRDEPQPEWQQHLRMPVDLDIDRLIAQEAPIAHLDVYIGLATAGLRSVEEHPVQRFLVLARHRRLQIPSVQFPAPPPPGGAPGRHWTRITIGLRSSEVSGLGDLLVNILDRVRDTSGESIDLLVDMSTQTPPRRFLGSFVPQGGPGSPHAVPHAMPPSGLDVPHSLPDTRGEWLTIALCDSAHDGGEARLLRLLEREYPGVELAGLTIARLFGTTVVFALGRRPAGDRPDVTALVARQATGPGDRHHGRPARATRQHVIVEESSTVDSLGRWSGAGVLFEVRARYTDRPGIFTALVEALRQNLARAVGGGYDGTGMDITFVHTSVADGRNAVASFTVALPGPANGTHFTADVLDRVERETRRVLVTRPPADPTDTDLGAFHTVRVALNLELVTVHPVRVDGPAEQSDRVIDLDAAGGGVGLQGGAWHGDREP